MTHHHTIHRFVYRAKRAFSQQLHNFVPSGHQTALPKARNRLERSSFTHVYMRRLRRMVATAHTHPSKDNYLKSRRAFTGARNIERMVCTHVVLFERTSGMTASCAILLEQDILKGHGMLFFCKLRVIKIHSFSGMNNHWRQCRKYAT